MNPSYILARVRDEPVRAVGEATLLFTILLVLFFTFRVVRTHLKLSHVPGPIFAGFSNLPRVFWVLSKRAHDIHIELHEKYGDLVRFGPNMVSVADPAEIPTLYPLKAGFVKSEFYKVLLPYTKGKALPSLFGTSDENIHKALKKPTASIFSHSNVLNFESYVDSTMNVLFEQLDRRFVNTNEVVDLGAWLQMFAFDVMGELTFSKSLGFLENGGDADGVMDKIWEHFAAAAPVTQMPWIDKFWNKNPILAYFRPSTASPILSFAMTRARERQAVEKDWDASVEVNNRDFLSRFIEAQAKDPEVPNWAVTVWTFSNIAAGSDSTAVVLRTIFYNLLKYPETMQKLQSELEEAKEAGRISLPCAWKEVRMLPYLDACVKEAIRMHPPFGLPFERVVPAGGATICRQFFEEGTVLGMSAWVTNRHKPTFGKDVDVWRPERWLCEEPERGVMEAAILTFGAGKRGCLGKYVAFLEIYKVVPTILQAYEIESVDLTAWSIENRWFVRQDGLKARLKRRE